MYEAAGGAGGGRALFSTEGDESEEEVVGSFEDSDGNHDTDEIVGEDVPGVVGFQLLFHHVDRPGFLTVKHAKKGGHESCSD